MKTKLPRDIKSLVNRKSHAAGIAYAVRERMELITALERMKDSGARLEEMRRHIEER
tara:strand:+ start:1134 stop:1304 length:171 start_codon:yes stop_codon:yes gene_type:complete